MKAIAFTIRLNSLYSIRIPFTWQSALTYPILPPSSVIGMLANALQRYKNNKRPLEYLKELEKQIEWAGSRLLGPCVIKSYTTSAITKWKEKLGGKFTNALGRQFAYTKLLQCVVVFNDEIPDGLTEAIVSIPLTCGDSESAVTVEEKPQIKMAKKIVLSEQKIVDTVFHVPLEVEGIEGKGRLYLMHERCLKKDKRFPLISYICPVEENKDLLMPSQLKVRCHQGNTIAEIDDLGTVVLNKSDGSKE